MGFLDSVFGESPKTEIKQQPLWADWQKNLAEGGLQGRLKRPDANLVPMENLFSTSLTGLEQYAQSLVAPQESDLTGMGKEGLGKVLSQGPQDIDEYFTKTVQEPLLELFQEDILPEISRRYAPSGFYSSQRLEADQRAQEELLDSLTRSRASISFGARENDLNRILQAAGIGLGEGFKREGLDLSRAELLRSFAGFASGVTSPEESQQSRRINELLAALQLRPFENIAVTSGGSSGLLGPLLQGAGTYMGGALGGGFNPFTWNPLG